MSLRVVPVPANQGGGKGPFQAIKANKDRLLKQLQENREKHSKEFVESWEGYRDRALQKLVNLKLKAASSFDKKIEELKSLSPGDAAEFSDHVPVNASIGLAVPVDHTREYERAVAHLEWELDAEVLVSENDFNRFVLDEWDWQGVFKATHKSYTG